ncbi:MAG: alpha/beta hydrolase [Gammaproteobacteria bacterium]|nr:alpha/beta hydrolase [Gammaproteobacteria bacterium]
MKYKVEHLEYADASLALHNWICGEPKAVVFYLHGVQSHAGWSFELGTYLANNGVTLFVLERRGIGFSSGTRGDINSLDKLLGDYYKALNMVKNRYPNIPITLFGQSFGGSVLAGLLSWDKFNLDYDAVAFCSSGLGKRHDLLTTVEYSSQLKDRSKQLLPLDIEDSDMTDLPWFLHFIAEDRYLCREITYRARAIMLEIEALYWNKKNIITDRPAAFICSVVDPLVNIKVATKVFQQLCGNKGMVLQLPSCKHYLWFTEQRYVLAGWLANFALTGGYKKIL